MPLPEKFRETLQDAKIDKNVVCKINCDYENVVSKTNKKIKCAYFEQAIKVMKEELSKEKSSRSFRG